MSVETAERYVRAFDPANEHDSLAKLARLIAPGVRVLDLGCGAGLLGAHLARDKGCVVDGLDRDAALFETAAPHYRHLWTADLDGPGLPPADQGLTYDVVVAADVLEHAVHPDLVLERLAGLLAPGGRILISMPNVAYGGVLAELMGGEFAYRPTGILDATHLRFFTRAGLIRLVEGAGLAVASLDGVRLDVARSEFGADGLDALPLAVRDFILGRPDADVYQWILEARPALPGEARAAEPRVAEPLALAPAPIPRFRAALDWRAEGAGFGRSPVLSAYGDLGRRDQWLTFTLPGTAGRIDHVRLTPTDRKGLISLGAIEARGPDGAPLWRHVPRRADFDGLWFENVVPADAVDGAGLVLAALGPEAGIELPLGGPLSPGDTIAVLMSAPLSSEYLALEGTWFGPDGPVARINAAEAKREQMRRVYERMAMESEGRVREIEDLMHERGALAKDIQGLMDTLGQVQAENRDLYEERGRLSHALADLRHQYDQSLAERDRLQQTGLALHRERAALNLDLAARRAEIADLQDQRAAAQAETTALYEERGGLYAERDGLHRALDAARAEVAGLQEERALLYSARDALQEAVNAARAENAALNEERARLYGERAALYEEREGLYAERDRLSAALDAETRRAADLARWLGEIQSAFDAVLASQSWRVTAPLRWVLSRLRG